MSTSGEISVKKRDRRTLRTMDAVAMWLWIALVIVLAVSIVACTMNTCDALVPMLLGVLVIAFPFIYAACTAEYENNRALVVTTFVDPDDE